MNCHNASFWGTNLIPKMHPWYTSHTKLWFCMGVIFSHTKEKILYGNLTFFKGPTFRDTYRNLKMFWCKNVISLFPNPKSSKYFQILVSVSECRAFEINIKKWFFVWEKFFLLIYSYFRSLKVAETFRNLFFYLYQCFLWTNCSQL